MKEIGRGRHSRSLGPTIVAITAILSDQCTTKAHPQEPIREVRALAKQAMTEKSVDVLFNIAKVARLRIRII